MEPIHYETNPTMNAGPRKQWINHRPFQFDSHVLSSSCIASMLSIFYPALVLKCCAVFCIKAKISNVPFVEDGHSFLLAI